VTIAELFVNIGIKGSDVTVRAISGIKGAMGELASASLETKAAILAIMYGLHEFTGAAGERGMELEKFANFTGLSADKLQRWQYAMKMSGVEAKDVEQSIKGLQSAMLKMSIGEGAPKGMQRLSEVVLKGGLDKKKWTDAFYMMDKLREYSKTEPNVALRNETMASFGLSPEMIQGMATSKIALDKIKPTQILGAGEIGQLSKVNTSWLELHHTLEMFGQKLVAKHGLAAVEGLAHLVPPILKLINALITLAEKLKVFEAIGEVFKVMAGAAEVVTTLMAPDEKKIMKGIEQKKQEQAARDKMTMGEYFSSLIHGGAKPSGVPNMKHEGGAASSKPANVNVNVHNHGVKDMHEGAHHVHKAVKSAFYQLQSQTMVT